METHCINMDAMTADELRCLASARGAHPKVRRYAKVKAEAMRHRLAGRIDAATCFEAECDRIYRTMPRALRW